MDFFSPREPINTWSHGLWLLWALPGTLLLWKRGAGDRRKQISLLIYGLSLMFCSGASTLFHGVRPGVGGLASYAVADHVGIYLLIAGSYTPIVRNLMRGRWRDVLLVSVWLWAFAGSAVQVICVDLPAWLTTVLYLMMGWFGVLFYYEIAGRHPFRVLAAIPVGGLIYSVGALLNLLQRPVLWPGVFQSHELFHLFVIVASLVHFHFLATVVAPFDAGATFDPPGPGTVRVKASPLAHPGRPAPGPVRGRPRRALLGRNASRGFSRPGTFPPG
jgi:hemolysin III